MTGRIDRVEPERSPTAYPPVTCKVQAIACPGPSCGMSEDDTDREQGVNFEPIDPLLEDLSYPVTADELVAEHGDRELERTNADPISIREIFEGMSDETFDSAESVRQSLLGMMPAESIGRQRYSDRGGSDQDDVDQEQMQEDNEKQVRDRKSE